MENMLAPFSYYWNGQLTPLNGQASSKKRNPLPLIVVVARGHYQELSRKLPISELAALKKVLANQTPAGFFALHQISPLQNRQRQVRSFYISEEIRTQFSGALFWLPESWLFGATLEEGNGRRIESPQSTYFVARLHHEVASLLTGPAVPDEVRFAHAIGAPELNLGEPVSTDNYAKELYQSFLRLSWQQLQSAFVIPDKALRSFNWKPWLIAGVSAWLLYQAAVSAYLYQGQQNASQAYQSQQLDNLLRQHEQANFLSQRTLGRIELLEKQQPKAKLWSVLARLIKQNVWVNSMEFDDAKWIIRGDVASASNVLEWLRNQPEVADARFDAPVRSVQGNKESFVISIILSPVVAQSQQGAESDA